MDVAKIRIEMEEMLKNLDTQNIDWKHVISQSRDIVAKNAPGVNGYNVKVGKDLGKKYNVEIVIPMVFKF